MCRVAGDKLLCDPIWQVTLRIAVSWNTSINGRQYQKLSYFYTVLVLAVLYNVEPRVQASLKYTVVGVEVELYDCFIRRPKGNWRTWVATVWLGGPQRSEM